MYCVHVFEKRGTRTTLIKTKHCSKKTPYYFLKKTGRTQSAPLPLGHPMLQGGLMAPPSTSTHYEEYVSERQLQEQQQTHNYLVKQQIRQTVLTRVGSRGAHLLDEAPESEESEVIDLTGKKDTSG